MTDIVSLDLASWQPALAADAQDAGDTDARRRRRAGPAASRVPAGRRRAALPVAALVRRQGEEHQLRRRQAQGRARLGRRARGAVAHDRAIRGRAPRLWSRRCFPRYAPYVRRARTSFRPQPAVGRAVSWRKDDSRLHVDAFPSRPNHGERILRVFSNVSPDEDRVWRVGESFEAVARTVSAEHSPRRSPARRDGCRRCTSPRACAARTII